MLDRQKLMGLGHLIGDVLEAVEEDVDRVNRPALVLSDDVRCNRPGIRQ